MASDVAGWGEWDAARFRMPAIQAVPASLTMLVERLAGLRFVRAVRMAMGAGTGLAAGGASGHVLLWTIVGVAVGSVFHAAAERPDA